MKSQNVTIQMKATAQYLPVVPFIILCKVVVTFGSVDEVAKCDHSNESYCAGLYSGTVYCAVHTPYSMVLQIIRADILRVA